MEDAYVGGPEYPIGQNMKANKKEKQCSCPENDSTTASHAGLSHCRALIQFQFLLYLSSFILELLDSPSNLVVSLESARVRTSFHLTPSSCVYLTFRFDRTVIHSLSVSLGSFLPFITCFVA